MWTDRYRGDKARTYERERSHTQRWAREQEAVAKLVTAGPVLDCPVGTGRYVPIYRDKGLDVVGIDASHDMLVVARETHAGLDARQGTVFALPFDDGAFGTAVCTRLLDWLHPDDMRRAVKELRRVSRELVVSIRYGEPGKRLNWTHRLADFYETVDGLHVACRVLTETTGDGIEMIFHMRPPDRADVVAQFRWHGHGKPASHVQRLTDEALAARGMASVDVAQAVVTARYPRVDDLHDVLIEMARHNRPAKPDGRYITDEAPRQPWRPVTLLQTGGETVLLDGRRRINRLARTCDGAERFPALVLVC